MLILFCNDLQETLESDENKDAKPKKSFEVPLGKQKIEAARATCEEDLSDIDDLDEDFEPVNVDFNLVKNLLDAHTSQQGLPGAGSNILSSMGIRLPDDDK